MQGDMQEGGRPPTSPSRIQCLLRLSPHGLAAFAPPPTLMTATAFSTIIPTNGSIVKRQKSPTAALHIFPRTAPEQHGRTVEKPHSAGPATTLPGKKQNCGPSAYPTIIQRETEYSVLANKILQTKKSAKHLVYSTKTATFALEIRNQAILKLNTSRSGAVGSSPGS